MAGHRVLAEPGGWHRYQFFPYYSCLVVQFILPGRYLYTCPLLERSRPLPLGLEVLPIAPDGVGIAAPAPFV